MNKQTPWLIRLDYQTNQTNQLNILFPYLDYSDYIKKGVDVFSSYVREWYTGNLQKLFFHRPENPAIKKQICAVLAGYVWDKTNPFVKRHHRIIETVAHMIGLEEEALEKDL